MAEGKYLVERDCVRGWEGIYWVVERTMLLLEGICLWVGDVVGREVFDFDKVA